jgi:hypothetical protein
LETTKGELLAKRAVLDLDLPFPGKELGLCLLDLWVFNSSRRSDDSPRFGGTAAGVVTASKQDSRENAFAAKREDYKLLTASKKVCAERERSLFGKCRPQRPRRT